MISTWATKISSVHAGIWPPVALARDDRVDGPDPRRRHEHHQERDQPHEIEVVQVTGLLEQEDVSEAEEEQHDRHAVEQADGDEERQHAEHPEVPVHALSRPGGDPLEARIVKEERRVDEIVGDPAVAEIAADLPHEDAAEHDAEHRHRGGIDRGEEIEEIGEVIGGCASIAARSDVPAVIAVSLPRTFIACSFSRACARFSGSLFKRRSLSIPEAASRPGLKEPPC